MQGMLLTFDNSACSFLFWHISWMWFFQIVDAIISHGCFLRECSVEHSIVGVRSRLDYGVELKVNYISLEC